jgi:FkbM family methyltransferase
MFYGQSRYGADELDRVLYETFFKNKRDGFFVECGAFDGFTECTCKFFEETMGWKGINIEPTPYAYGKLVRNRPYSINENCALSAKSGRATFTNAIHPNLGLHFGNGSLSHTKEHKDELIATGCKFETFEVECVRFVELYKKHNLPDIDLFVLDVEGHELEALNGILDIPHSALPKIFCIEHTIAGLDELVKILDLQYTHHSNHHHNSFFVKK